MALAKKNQMKRIMVLGDCQVKENVPLNYLKWVRRYALEQKGEIATFVEIGDFSDVHSLSYWDKGTFSWQGRSYKTDVDVSKFALDLLQPAALGIQDTVHLDGNHEDRITKTTEKVPELHGTIAISDLGYNDHYAHCGEFGEIIMRHGIAFSHFFKAKNTKNPIGGLMGNKLAKIGYSFVAGHTPGLEMHAETLGNGTMRCGVVNGASYLHYEHYKGHQDNGHFRGIVMLNEVTGNGSFQPQPISMDYLCRKYEGMTLAQFAKRPSKWICYGKADKESMRWAK